MKFRNVVLPDKYRVDVDEAGLRAQMADLEIVLPWDSIQELSFGQYAPGEVLVGYVRVVGADGSEIAWTDQHNVLRKDSAYWKEGAFHVPASREGTLPLLSLASGRTYASQDVRGRVTMYPRGGRLCEKRT